MRPLPGPGGGVFGGGLGVRGAPRRFRAPPSTTRLRQVLAAVPMACLRVGPDRSLPEAGQAR
ncbi:hypothetical protein SSCG_00516 [Streptomyces clavuligerus]|nr:hypothetical protein SSCG_00516 [Streptomyces clavuligerus]